MIRNDCRFFRGDKPCRFKRLCEECPQFAPILQKILIIKCRAQGDVLRTTPLLPALKRKYPESFISWLVDEESLDLLLNNPYIDRLHPFNLENVIALTSEKFDVLISLDKEPGLTALAEKVSSSKKLGFGMNEFGNLKIFNPAAEYAFRLGVDDSLKFTQNVKTYQEIIHEMADVEYRGEDYVFGLEDQSKVKARSFFKKHGLSIKGPAVGLNTGAGTKFETKQWPASNYLKLIEMLTRKLRASVFLLGGKRERELNRFLEKKSKVRVYNTGNDNSLLEFAGFLSLMDVVVTSDTLGMHLAIALKRKAAVLFGPTCPQEIELYGRGSKLFAGIPCSPCYKQTCSDPRCMKEISSREVFEEVKKLV
jgi:lipopolysaccharide heptosyltransferase III